MDVKRFPFVFLASFFLFPSLLLADADPDVMWVNLPLEQKEIDSLNEKGLMARKLSKEEMKTLEFSIPKPAAAPGEEDSCRAVLEHAVHVYASEFSVDDKKAWTYAKKCGSSAGSSNIGVDIIIEEMPIGLSAGEQSREQWCNTNESYRTRYQAYQKLENRVFATAISNWRQCMLAKQNNLFTTVNVSTTDTVFQFNVKNGTAHNENITRVSVLSDLGEGISCSPEVSDDDPIVVGPNQTKSILCSREFVEVVRSGESYEVLPAGTITFDNTLSPFFYTFNERFKTDDVPDPEIPPKLIVRLDGQHIATRGYWAGGRASSMLYCSTRIDIPQAGYELVEVTGRREERAPFGQPRGRCGRAPYCDSHNEFCNEVYFGKSCFINKEWHDWYKAWATQHGVGYSKESVCTPESS